MFIFFDILPCLLIFPFGQMETAKPSVKDLVPTIPAEYDRAKIEKYVKEVVKEKNSSVWKWW